jgi:hypothetical protein
MNKNKKLPSLSLILGPEYLRKKVHVTVFDSKHNGIEVSKLIRNLLNTIP